jgi:hypothetical protein
VCSGEEEDVGGWVMRDVNALVESERFRLTEAFSAQIAHWSCGRDQYFPRFSFAGLWVFAVWARPRVEWVPEGRRDEREETVRWEAMRLMRLRMLRALMRGSRKRRNSCVCKYDAEVYKGNKWRPYSESVPDHLAIHKFVAYVALYESARWYQTHAEYPVRYRAVSG